MPFRTLDEVEARLVRSPAPLTSTEIRDLYPWMQVLSAGAVRRLDAELALQNLDAIRRFDDNSSRVAWWSLLLNVALFGLTVIAVIIAIVTYRSAEASSRLQQQALNASRNALESVVATATAQQNVLQRTLSTSEAQLKILEAQWAAELERIARRPAVQVIFGDLVLSNTRNPIKLSLSVNPDNRGRLTFLVKNTGNAPINSPTIIMTALPDTVVLGPPSGLGFVGDNATNRYQINRAMDIQPVSLTKMPVAFEADAVVPKDLAEFAVQFLIFGSNLPSQWFNVRFKVVHNG